MGKKQLITFKRNRAIMRDGIRVGWIEDLGTDATHGRWQVRFTAASGMPGVFGTFRRLTVAKTDAAIALSGRTP